MANILLMYQLAFHFPNKNILAPPSTFNLHCKVKRIIIFFDNNKNDERKKLVDDDSLPL